MTLQDVFGAALLEKVGPTARERGYKRSRRVWRRSNGRGDWVAFDVQSSQWNTSGSVECVVNLGAAPAPWLDYQSDRYGRQGGSFAPAWGIFQTRLRPERRAGEAETWWHLERDLEAESVAADIADSLSRGGYSVLDELLNRDHFVARIRNGQMGHFSEPNPIWLATVLADQGPSTDLDEALASASSWLDHSDALQLEVWCARRARANRS